MQKLLEHQMTQKEARKIMLWRAIERYRTAGGREEHHAYKEALDNYIDDMLDIEEMDEVAHRFAHPLALELECVLADRNATWTSDVACKLSEIAAFADYVGALMKEAEWLYSGDTGEDTFTQRVREIEATRGVMRLERLPSNAGVER